MGAEHTYYLPLFLTVTTCLLIMQLLRIIFMIVSFPRLGVLSLGLLLYVAKNRVWGSTILDDDNNLLTSFRARIDKYLVLCKFVMIYLILLKFSQPEGRRASKSRCRRRHSSMQVEVGLGEDN